MGKLSTQRKSRFEVGELPLRDNQFTSAELLMYMNRVWGGKVNGLKFTASNIIGWSYRGYIPDSYGGGKVTSQLLSNIVVHTLEDMSREDMRYARDVLTERAKPKKLGGKARVRTALYHKISKRPVTEYMIPDNWKELGIKRVQLGNKRRSYAPMIND
jgi:hypothetical protein